VDVGWVVVDLHVQLTAWVGSGDLLEEGHELWAAMPLGGGVARLAGGHVQCGEQRGGAVPDVVEGLPLREPGGVGSAGAVRLSAVT
jgi:hypothetical protein